MKSRENIIYVVSCEIRHGNPSDRQGDGTAVLGVFDDRELAEHRLVEEYDRDKFDLNEGSCCPDGTCEITEDEPIETHGTGEGKDYNACAQLTVCDRKLGTVECSYTYTISTKTLNA